MLLETRWHYNAFICNNIASVREYVRLDLLDLNPELKHYFILWLKIASEGACLH